MARSVSPYSGGTVPDLHRVPFPLADCAGETTIRRRGRLVVAARWLPVVVWAALIFALSSVPSPRLGLGAWDLGLRKLAHLAEYAVLGALLARALPELAAAVRSGSPTRRATRCTSRSCRAARVAARRRDRRHRRARWAILLLRRPDAVTRRRIDLDGVLGDTHPLWQDWLSDASRRLASIAPLEPAALPDDRGAAAAELDRWADEASATGAPRWSGSPPTRARLPPPRRRDERALRRLQASRHAARRLHGRARAARAHCARPARSGAPPRGSRDRRRRARAPARAARRRHRVVRSREELRRLPAGLQTVRMDRGDLSDRQFEAMLERLDRLVAEVRRLNDRLERSDDLQRISRELSLLNESLGALAYAALGQQAPHVRRRRSA